MTRVPLLGLAHVDDDGTVAVAAALVVDLGGVDLRDLPANLPDDLGCGRAHGRANPFDTWSSFNASRSIAA